MGLSESRDHLVTIDCKHGSICAPLLAEAAQPKRYKAFRKKVSARCEMFSTRAVGTTALR